MDELDETRFERDLGQALDTLRQGRHGCPEPDLLLAFATGELGDSDTSSSEELSARIEAHLGTCIACLEVADAAFTDSVPLDDITWNRVERRLDARDAPWCHRADAVAPSRRSVRSVLLLVAVLFAGAILGSSGVILLGSRSSPPATPTSIERGGGPIVLVTPLGEASEASHFEWRLTLPANLSFRLEVEQNGENIFSQVVASGDTTRVRIPTIVEQRLAARAKLRWRVVGLSSTGREIARSDWAPLGSPPVPPR